MTNYSLIKAAYDMIKYKTEEKEYINEVENLEIQKFQNIIKE